MTFSDLQTKVYQGVLRDDLNGSYGEFVNNALREIQNRRSWVFMKDTVDPFTIPQGSGRETGALPSDFKELQKRPAVHYLAEDTSPAGLVPADVVTEEQQAFRVWAFGGTPITTWPPRVYLERTATGALLGLIEPIVQDMHFRVKYYKYLPDLVADSDQSPIANAYPEMVIAKAKAIAFARVNDYDAATGAEGYFEKKLAEAIRQDAYSEVVGRENRM